MAKYIRHVFPIVLLLSAGAGLLTATAASAEPCYSQEDCTIKRTQQEMVRDDKYRQAEATRQQALSDEMAANRAAAHAEAYQRAESGKASRVDEVMRRRRARAAAAAEAAAGN